MNRLCSFLGLCRRAGKLTFGAEKTLQAAKDKRIFLAVITSDVSEKTEKEIRFVCNDGVQVLKINLKSEETGLVLGLPCKVLGVTDRSMAGKITDLASQELSKEE